MPTAADDRASVGVEDDRAGSVPAVTTAAQDQPTDTVAPAGPLERHPFAWRPVLAVAVAQLAVLLALAGRYGPHRDELYFVSAGRRLAWGYPDQPPLTPLIARLADLVAPGSVFALHVVPAVMVAGVVVMTALTARELGAGPSAQVLSAVVIATGAGLATVGHMLSTTTTDTTIWVAIVLLVVRVLVRDWQRGWLAVGLVAGVGLLDKHLVAFLVGAIVVGVAATQRTRHHLRSPWAWAGVAIAVALWAPNLVWQAAHGWPQLELAADIKDEYLTPGERVRFVVLLVILVSPVAVALWGYGWRRLVRAPELTPVRPLAWAFALLAVGFFATGGKAYYLLGVLPVLLAAGADGLCRSWGTARVRRAGWVLAGAGLVAVPVVLPVLPVQTYADAGLTDISEDQAEMIGWPALVATVHDAVEGSGAELVVTGNYGEAGALEFYGSSAPVYSGHNGFADWGPPPEALAGPVVVIGWGTDPEWAQGCREVARVDNGLGVENEEQGGAVLVCDGPRGTWAEAWEQVRHLSA